MNAQTKASQDAISPAKALELLKEGNQRFTAKQQVERDLNLQVEQTSTGQFPFATVLSCIDSRVPAELVFDQGIGDIFSVRIAGNFVNSDILGSMEFASKLAGTKLILVLGHTACGAVKGACDHAELGNLTGMLDKIAPAVEAVTEPAAAADRTSANIDFVNAVGAKNVTLTIERIREESPVLAEMEQAGEIQIVGGMYDIATGQVNFL
ncbi:MAG: carbonic anhydrase family protein [Flavobacteriaceae bacterium]|nr:carbonic anhydrase family protein [Flavobacteriaceae bacterium]